MSEATEVADGLEQRSRRGRKVQLSTEEREVLILDAMERIVAESGLQRASMAAIAVEAGMSKRTLYAVYGSREAMFEAWVRRKRARHVRPLAAADAALPVAERLRRVLRAEDCGNMRGDRGLMVLRAVIAEAPHHPEVARTVLLAGAEAARRVVAAELVRAVDRGELAIADIDAAAELLIDMVGHNPLHGLLDPEVWQSWPAKADARLELAIDTFLHGCAVREAPDA